MDPCAETGESRTDPGHVHSCSGKHNAGKIVPHFCPGCRRWWFFG